MPAVFMQWEYDGDQESQKFCFQGVYFSWEKKTNMSENK